MINYLDPTDIYRTFFSIIAECKFFSSTHGTFCRVTICKVIKCYKKFKRTEIIQNVFDHNGIIINHNTLIINNRRKLYYLIHDIFMFFTTERSLTYSHPWENSS